MSARAALPHRAFVRAIAADATATSFLEIGVRDGDSTVAAVAGAAQTLCLIALCDTWGPHHGGVNRGSHDYVAARLADVGYSGQILWLDGASAEQIPTLRGRRFDVVHIDGDHSEAGALRDLRQCWPLAARVLVCHDIFMLPVWQAVSTWLSEIVSEVSRIEVSACDHGTIAVWR